VAYEQDTSNAAKLTAVIVLALVGLRLASKALALSFVRWSLAGAEDSVMEFMQDCGS
jgi:hypothetical protein